MLEIDLWHHLRLRHIAQFDISLSTKWKATDDRSFLVGLHFQRAKISNWPALRKWFLVTSVFRAICRNGPMRCDFCARALANIMRNRGISPIASSRVIFARKYILAFSSIPEYFASAAIAHHSFSPSFFLCIISDVFPELGNIGGTNYSIGTIDEFITTSQFGKTEYIFRNWLQRNL